MMKKPLFTFVIPAFNGSPFIDDSINSLINQRIIDSNIHKFYEIIIVNDGSTDDTVEKANAHADNWNKIVGDNKFIRVIDKPNGQYGSVINRSIKEANGVYFKVLDVDDTFNQTSLIKIIKIIHGLPKKPDVIFTDHTFEKVESNIKEIHSLRKSFVPYKIMDIDKVRWPKDLITMHSVIYRLDLLKDIEYKQIEGVFYSDSQYSLIPLGFANTMYYINMPLYRYYVGRGEQSINLKVMVRNRLHQLQVLERIWTEISFEFNNSKELKKYYRTVLKQMAQWQIMLISYDKSINHKPKYIRDFMKMLKGMQPSEYWSISNNIVFWLARIFRGHGLSWMIKIGIKIYSFFKKNILAEWD